MVPIPQVRTVVENAVTVHQYVGPQQRVVEDPTNLYILKDQAIEIIELRAELSKMESALQRSRVDHAHTKRLLTVCEDQTRIQLQSLHNRAKMMENELREKEQQSMQLQNEFKEKERRVHEADQREREIQENIHRKQNDIVQLEQSLNQEMQKSFEAENSARMFLEKLRDLEHAYRELEITYEETKAMKVAHQKLVKAVPVTTMSEKGRKKLAKSESKRLSGRGSENEFQTPISSHFTNGSSGSTRGSAFPAPSDAAPGRNDRMERFEGMQGQGHSGLVDYDDRPQISDNAIDFSRGQVTGYEV